MKPKFNDKLGCLLMHGTPLVTFAVYPLLFYEVSLNNFNSLPKTFH